MNRQQRRALWRMAKGDPDALWCPECKHKTIHIAESIGDVDHYDVFCEVCHRRIGRSKIGENGVSGDGPVKGRYWTKGDITLKVKSFMDKYFEEDAHEICSESNRRQPVSSGSESTRLDGDVDSEA